jgi:hypothetical protein
MENQSPNIEDSNTVVEHLYNIVDSDANIIESNVSNEYITQLLTDMNVEDGNLETRYFYWPNDNLILEALISESNTPLRFFKHITE